MRKRLAATALIFSVCLFLSGCLLNVPDIYYEPETVGEVAKIVLHVAFVKPWILVPAFWRVCSNPDDLSVAMIILIFFVGGIHFAIGAIAIKLAEKLGITSSSSPSPSKETKDLPTPLVLPVFLLMIAILSGMIMSVYGLFIWISCLIVTLLGFLL